MTIDVTCPRCDKRFRTSKDAAGRRAQCTDCKTVFEVRVSAPDESRRAPASTASALASDKALVRCDHCSASFPVHRELLGRQATCSQCRKPFVLSEIETRAQAAAAPVEVTPAPAPTPAPTTTPATPPAQVPTPEEDLSQMLDGVDLEAKAETVGRPDGMSPEQLQKARETLLKQIQGEFEPPTFAFSYRLSTAVVCLLVMMLPVVYVGLTLGIAALALWLTVSGSGFGFLAVIPGLAGIVLFLLLIKPLFAGRGPKEHRRELRREEEPFYFAYVEKLCTYLKAPFPDHLYVDSEVNASIRWRSLFDGETELTIGLPLVKGMTVRQVSSTLAHEIGHLTQVGSVSPEHVMRRVHIWFARIVFERDVIDVWLAKLAYGLDIRIGFIFHGIRACIWVSRRILWVFWMLSWWALSYASRQAEYDADEFAVRLAGSNVFEAEGRRIVELGYSYGKAMDDLSRYHREGRLVDNFPELVRASSELLIDDEFRELLDVFEKERKTRWEDTHPSWAERFEFSNDLNAPGILRADCPATVLFSDIDALCRQATWALYKNCLGEKNVKRGELRPVGELIERQKVENAGHEAIGQFFQRSHTFLRQLLPLSACFPAPTDPRAAAEIVCNERKSMHDLRIAYEDNADAYGEADDRAMEAMRAIAVYDAGLTPREEAFNVPVGTPYTAERSLAREERTKRTAALNMNAYEAAAGERLAADLGLLWHASLDARMPDVQEARGRCKQMAPLVEFLQAWHSKWLALRVDLVKLGFHLQIVQNSEGVTQQLYDHVMHKTRVLHDQLKAIRKMIPDAPYPFEDMEEAIQLADYLVSEVPPRDEPYLIFEQTEQFGDRFGKLYVRVLGELLQVALAVESAMGLKPMPLPKLLEKRNRKKNAEK